MPWIGHNQNLAFETSEGSKGSERISYDVSRWWSNPKYISLSSWNQHVQICFAWFSYIHSSFGHFPPFKPLEGLLLFALPGAEDHACGAMTEQRRQQILHVKRLPCRRTETIRFRGVCPLPAGLHESVVVYISQKVLKLSDLSFLSNQMMSCWLVDFWG